MARRNRPLSQDPPREPAPAPAAPSRSQLKREAAALQTLGQQLTTLPAPRLAQVPMPEGLRQALEEFRRTSSHEGRRRQLQYIGKQMRAADPAPLREAVAAMRLQPAREALALHQAERWRDELLADDHALTRWLRHFPDSDAATLRRLLRAARAEGLAPLAQRQGKAYRALFQFLKPWLQPPPDAAAPTVADGDGVGDGDGDGHGEGHGEGGDHGHSSLRNDSNDHGLRGRDDDAPDPHPARARA